MEETQEEFNARFYREHVKPFEDTYPEIMQAMRERKLTDKETATLVFGEVSFPSGPNYDQILQHRWIALGVLACNSGFSEQISGDDRNLITEALLNLLRAKHPETLNICGYLESALINKEVIANIQPLITEIRIKLGAGAPSWDSPNPTESGPF